MPYDAIEIDKRAQSLGELRKSHSPLSVSAMESLNAALWLIGGGGWLIPQALSLLHNSIELAFKGELECIHRALIADGRRWGYEELKAILREAFLAHPKGATMELPEFEMDKTITFWEAMKRAKDLYPELISRWESKLKVFHSQRNDVVHYGSDPSRLSEYLSNIVCTGLPFLEEFVTQVYGMPLEDIVMESIDREINVARAVVEELQKEGVQAKLYALNTIRIATAYHASMEPVFVDKDGYIKDEGDRDFKLAMQARNEFEKEGNDVDIEASCKICGGYPLLVCLDIHGESKEVRASAISCFKCGLSIDKEQKHLAHFHFGNITEEDRIRYLKDIGEL